MEKVLLFNCKEEEKLKRILSDMHIKSMNVTKDLYQTEIQKIVDGIAVTGEFEGSIPTDSLILMCNLDKKKFDRLLANIKQKNIQITYKAVLTPTNSKWNPLRLFAHMKMEQQAAASFINTRNK